MNVDITHSLLDLNASISCFKKKPDPFLNSLQKQVELILSQVDFLPKASQQMLAVALNKIRDIKTRSEVSSIATSLLQCEKQLEANLEVPKTALSVNEKILRLGIHFDLGSEDYNGAIRATLFESIKAKIPIITTRALLAGTSQTESSTTSNADFVKQSDEWEIYCLDTGIKAREFLLLLPKGGTSDDAPERLKSLGFAAENLKPLSFWEAVAGPHAPPPSINDFYQFFNNEPVSKYVYMDGHGNGTSTAGLEEEDLKSLIKFFAKKDVRSLFALSCHSGGPITHTYLPKAKHKEYKDSFSHAPLCPFPVIVSSIGSFSVNGVTVNFTRYFECMETIMESGKPLTIKAIQEAIGQFGDLDIRHTGFWFKVLLPTAKVAPARFHCGFYKTERPYSFVEDVGTHMQSPALEIAVDKEIMELLPLHVRQPLVLSPQTALLSMVQGSSHHLLSSVRLQAGSLNEWLETNHKTIYQHEKFTDREKKAFFIGAFKTPTEEYKNLAIDFSNKTTTILYEKAGRHYFIKEGTASEISEDEFICETALLFKATRSSEKGERSASGGQESEEELFSKIMAQFRGSSPLPDLFNGKTLESLSCEQKQLLLTLAVFYNKKELAKQLVNEPGIDVNRPTRRKHHLLDCAVRNGDVELATGLIAKGADINAQEPHSLHTPFFSALSANVQPLIDHFLAQPNLNLQVVNSRGWNALLSAPDDQLEKLLAHPSKPSLNQVSKTGYTLLSLAASNGELAKVKKLLTLGADMQAGTPAPLIQAIRGCHEDVVAFLLENAAEDLNAVVEAIERSTPRITDLLLEKCNLANDTMKEKVLLAAAKRGNSQLFVKLVGMGCKFPAGENRAVLTPLLHRIIHENDIGSFKILLEVTSEEFNCRYGMESSRLLEVLVDFDRPEMIACLHQKERLAWMDDVALQAYRQNKLGVIEQLITANFRVDDLLKLAVKLCDANTVSMCLKSEKTSGHIYVETLISAVKEGNLEIITQLVNKLEEIKYGRLTNESADKIINALQPDCQPEIIALLCKTWPPLILALFKSIDFTDQQKVHLLSAVERVESDDIALRCMQHAIKQQSVSLVSLLFSKNVPWEVGQGKCYTDALKKGTVDIVQAFLTKGANPNECMGIVSKESPLMMALDRGRDFIEALLRAGADPLVAKKYNSPFLSKLAEKGEWELFSQCLAGRKISQELAKTLIDKTGSQEKAQIQIELQAYA